jgi:hypothetical protein
MAHLGQIINTACKATIMSDSQQSELQDDPQFQAILAECLETLEQGGAVGS